MSVPDLLKAIQDSRFTTNDKKALVAKACQVANQKLRNDMQDYTSLFSYMANSDWDLLLARTGSQAVKDMVCMKKIEMLGGRNLDEWSWKWCASLLTSWKLATPHQ